jgi:hypothetical protein
MRWRFLIVCGLLGLLTGGCERRIPQDELGTVVFALPKVPGADNRPPTPGLDDLAPPGSPSTPPKRPMPLPEDSAQRKFTAPSPNPAKPLHSF